jgi:hypothetical protein
MCFAISQAEFKRKGTTQGELLAIVGLGNILGSLMGGVLIGMFGYTVGFGVAGGDCSDFITNTSLHRNRNQKRLFVAPELG